MKLKGFKIVLMLCCSLFVNYNWGQTNEEKQLKAKRNKLIKEIALINKSLTKEQAQKTTLLSQVDHLNFKINTREELVRTASRELNLLNRQIRANAKKIRELDKDLKQLKESYAAMIRKSYASRSKESKLMFLFSSQDFFQAYKRFQYLKQYTKHRKAQGEEIKARVVEMQDRQQKLKTDKVEKDALYTENKKHQLALIDEKKDQQVLLQKVKRNERKYKTQIKTRQGRVSAIDREIQRLISLAIKNTNKKSGKSTSNNTFALTPADRLVANNFKANRGKFGWPVRNGVLKQGFGEYKDPFYPGIKHINNGVHIATHKEAKARSIFKGEVFSVTKMRNGNWMVYTKHGDYLCVYYPLKSVKVQKGDKLSKYQDIGTIEQDRLYKKTVLKFFLYKNAVKLNPQRWLTNM
jgi:septal ring factor EnvC (AmiA/AmiB activator)